MKKYSIFIPLILILLITSCNDYQADSPIIRETLESKNVLVEQGSVGLVDLKKLVDNPGGNLFTIDNMSDFDGRLKLLDNGYLAYQAPDFETSEEVFLEIINDENNEISQATLEFEVQNLPVGQGNCYTNFDNAVLNNQAITVDALLRDTACGRIPRRGVFQVLFPFEDLDYTFNENGILEVEPNPGGRGFNLLAYYGEYEGLDSAYVGLLQVTNQQGCFPFGANDDFQVDFSPGVLSYELDVLENDIFCEWSREDAEITSIFGSFDFGQINILDGQTLEYTLDQPITQPITENFQYAAKYKNGVGNSFSIHCCFPVTLQLRP